MTKKGGEKLRFAPIIRVSTEAQEKKGESLGLQKKQIKDTVKFLGGSIPKHCWQYCGQEHATPNQERKLFNKMLADCEDDLFDAVIFAEPTRWARDQEIHARAVKVLQKNGKRLFMGTTEFNLNDPSAKRMLGYAAVDAESTAGQMQKSSVLGKIEIAKRGFPINGRILFGRKLLNPQDRSVKTKKAEYDITPKDQKFAQKIADRYIAGESFEKLHKQQNRLGLSTLRRVITRQSGPKWQRKFECEEFGIKETFETDIAELLDKKTRDAIKKRIELNTSLDRGYIKHKYLLKSLIRCGYCGKKFYGKTYKNGQVYYRHNKPLCGHIYSIKADRLELPVLAKVLQVTHDYEAAEEAIKLAIPDQKERKKLTAERKKQQRKLAKLKTDKSNLLRVAKKAGADSDEEVVAELAIIREQQLEIKNTVKQIEYKLDEMPDPDDEMTKMQMQTMTQIIRSHYRSPARILKMDFDKRRELLKHLFDGKRYCIRLFRGDTNPLTGRPIKHPERCLPNEYAFKLDWRYKFEEVGRVPMSDWYLMELLELDKKEYADLISLCKLDLVSP